MKLQEQLSLLDSIQNKSNRLIAFETKLPEFGYTDIRPKEPEIMQINLGRICNQYCKHCHVNAGIDNTDTMSKNTMEQCLAVLDKTNIPVVDITGGAPEMNEHFRWFVSECAKRNKTVMVRNNLTVFFHKDEYFDLPEFYAKNKVIIIASLPFYNASKTDNIRGDGVFKNSIKGIQLLNNVGYGTPESDLTLNLVYNPAGAFLPGSQKDLEREFKTQLKHNYEVTFNNLLTITNMPLGRYLEYLISSENLIPYMEKLVEAFNPASVTEMMCRNTISVRWDGYVYDCDFNQMLDIKSDVPGHQHISQFNKDMFVKRNIMFSQHCFGCTAGSGSSCGGATV